MARGTQSVPRHLPKSCSIHTSAHGPWKCYHLPTTRSTSAPCGSQCANSSPPSAHTCALGLRALKCVKLSACSKHALKYKRELSASLCTLAVSINGVISLILLRTKTHDHLSFARHTRRHTAKCTKPGFRQLSSPPAREHSPAYSREAKYTTPAKQHSLKKQRSRAQAGLIRPAC